MFLIKRLTVRNLIKLIVDSMSFPLSRRLKKIHGTKYKGLVAQWHN